MDLEAGRMEKYVEPPKSRKMVGLFRFRSPGKKTSSIDKKSRWRVCILIFVCGFMTFLLVRSTTRISTSTNSVPKLLPQPQQQKPIQHHFLGAVIFNRVFKEDKFNISGWECRQWVEYMLYAGVDHVYWYDTAHSDSESQELSLADYVTLGKLTYHRFYHLFPAIEDTDFHYEQDNSYKHFISNYNATMDWVVEMDVDEYPFSSLDTEPGFLVRFLKRQRQEISQVLLECIIFAGNPRDEPGRQQLMVERYTRRNPTSEGRTPGFGSRHKPIFRPNWCFGVTNFDPHSFKMSRGETLVAYAQELRMNHYWGPRETDFGPDTPEVIEKLVEDKSILPIASKLKKISSNGLV